MCPPIFAFSEEKVKNNLGIRISIHMEIKLAVRLDQMNDPIDAVPLHRQPQPANGLHCIKRAQDDALRALLLLEDIDRCQIWLKANHIDRLSQVVIDFGAWAVNEDVLFECAPGKFYPYIS